MTKKIYLIVVLQVIGFWFLPVTVAAQDIPAIRNPVCWSEDDCKYQIGNVYHGTYNADLNWLPGGPNGECGSMGACIPAGKAQLSIKIGGSSVVSNIGDYIKTVYIYLIGIGGIVAVVLILKGGFEYVTSAGSPERVTSAKSTITSALIGLFLLLGSYTMLYTINPDLLQLKLPRVFMLRAITLGTDWCKDQPEVAKLALAKATASDKEREMSDYKPSDFTIPTQPKEEDVKSAQNSATLDPTKMPICGATYFSNAGSAGTCNGHVCKNDNEGKIQTCVRVANSYKCTKSLMSGVITGSGIVAPFIDNNLKLVSICKDGKGQSVLDNIDLDTDKKATKQTYFFTFDLEKAKAAAPNAVDCGFFLVAEINDDNGVDDFYVVGKDGSVCNKNLNQAFGLGNDIMSAPWWQRVYTNFASLQPYLIKLSELENGLICDMPLSRSAFPAL